MHRKYSNFLIISFVATLIVSGYLYFFNNSKTEASFLGSSLTSSLDNALDATKASTVDPKTTEDISFLNKLISLKNIKIDTSLFSNKSFNLLQNNNIKLNAVVPGRSNPFSPTEKVVNNNVALLTTSPVTSLSTKSAVLNGFVESGVTTTNVYFEYGSTESLGKVTTKLNPSMIGSYSFNLTGLNPKTTYFFRIVATINGAISFGDIVSFNTN